MQRVLVATSNPGKLEEYKAILNDVPFDFILPSEIDLVDFDPEEVGESFSEIATHKAKMYALKAGLPSLADDSGLSVDALSGRPGIFSKRYGQSDEERISKLLGELEGVPDEKRTAHFTCAIALYYPETQKNMVVEGIVEGIIAHTPRGSNGFGYDPVFIPTELGEDKTFAELGSAIKNKISHRARALEKLHKQLSLRN